VYIYYQNTYTLHNLNKHTHTHTHTHTHIYIYIYIHTHTQLQNIIKPPQYKLKQTQFKIHPNETVTI
jgi:hypothetical protein